MRILFAGTPDIAVPSLKAVAASHEICGVLTSPDRRSGRGRRMAQSPVKAAALDMGLAVFQPQRLGATAREEVTTFQPEILVVVAYGKIFGPMFLSLFSRGGVNLHPSLLPKYRGPAPIPAAILNGEQQTGVSVQQLALEMDAGPVYAQEKMVLDGTETTASLSARAAEKGAALLAQVLDDIERGTAKPEPQDHDGATYCTLIRKEDGLVDWSADATEIDRMVRAYDPWPRAYAYVGDTKLSILRSSVAWSLAAPTGRSGVEPGTVCGVDKKNGILIQTGNGMLAVQKLQLQSKRALEWKEFLNGAPEFIGATLKGR